MGFSFSPALLSGNPEKILEIAGTYLGILFSGSNYLIDFNIKDDDGDDDYDNDNNNKTTIIIIVVVTMLEKLATYTF